MTTTAPAMKYVRLGNSGLKVSRIILGCMSYGDPDWQGWVLPEQDGIQHIKAAYDMGINAFDTANVYSNGASEVILGKAIRELQLPRDELVILTKVFFPTRDKSQPELPFGIINQKGLNRKHIFDSVKKSLNHLQLDYIDVLQCHRFDPETSIEETMQALHDVVKAGFVRYIGMSSCWAWQFHAMQNYAVQNKLTPFISMQNHHSLIYREEEREMFPTLKLFGVGAIPWSPLARGFLTRPWAEKTTTRSTTDPFISRHEAPGAGKTIVDRVQEVAKKMNLSMAQIALIWSMNKEGVTAPIVGTTSLEKLRELVAVADTQLSAEDTKYLEEAYVPQEISGHT